MTNTFSPFENDSQQKEISGLSIDNGKTEICLSGTLVITKSKDGLALANNLQEALNAIVEKLKSESSLPESMTIEEPVIKTAPSPFES